MMMMMMFAYRNYNKMHQIVVPPASLLELGLGLTPTLTHVFLHKLSNPNTNPNPNPNLIIAPLANLSRPYLNSQATYPHADPLSRPNPNPNPLSRPNPNPNPLSRPNPNPNRQSLTVALRYYY
jgi:hypothetical protein